MNTQSVMCWGLAGGSPYPTNPAHARASQTLPKARSAVSIYPTSNALILLTCLLLSFPHLIQLVLIPDELAAINALCAQATILSNLCGFLGYLRVISVFNFSVLLVYILFMSMLFSKHFVPRLPYSTISSMYT